MPDREQRRPPPKREEEPRPPDRGSPPPGRDPLDDLDKDEERHEEHVDKDENSKE